MTNAAEWSILNTEPRRFSANATSALQALGRVTAVDAQREYLLHHASAFDVIFIGLANIIDREIITRATRLRCIVTPTTGTDHVDVDCLRDRGVTLLSLKGETEFLESVSATAELTWGLVLALARKIVGAHADVMVGNWRRDAFGGLELQSKTLGIIGYGRLGRMVAGYARAFRMRVLAFDRTPASDRGVEFVQLETLLAESDVISVHLPLDESTAGFLDRRRIGAMKDGALLINTSRGAIIDETAMLDALRAGKLGGAALDVLASETAMGRWVPDDPLVRYASAHSNLVITPHIGGMTAESAERTNLFMIDKLASYLAQHDVKRART